LTTDHPDHEQLAAFQAGDGDRRQRADLEAHLAGCPACAEVVASVERARDRLAVLEEPDLPPGLHDRLAAAVEAEAAEAAKSGAAARPATRLGRPAGRGAAGRARVPGPAGVERRRERAVPWYRRPVAWGAAAAVLLAALIAVPLLDRSPELSTASGGAGGGQAAQEAGDTAAGDAGTLPVVRLPGEVTVAAVRARLATDYRARMALEGGAAVSPPGTQAAPVSPPGTQAAPTQPQFNADSSTAEGSRSAAPSQTGAGSVSACFVAATAAANPALRPLNPAFFVEGTYKGRPATVLVTTSTAEPGRADLWVFPRNDCSAAPLATKRLR
jgi:hypothetical protein